MIDTSRVLLAAALLLAGCAGQYPSDRPGPPVTTPDDGGQPPVKEPDAEVPQAPAPAPRSNTDAPTLALLRQSERSADDGDLDAAIAYVERAIRLNPRDAELWLRLGRLQLDAEHPARAEQLAQKAIALARDDDHERAGWLLVADALDAQGDDEEAARIRARWRTFRG